MTESSKEKKITPEAANKALDAEQYLHMYEQMLKIRYFDEEVNELYKTAKMPGLAHLYIGQEAVAVGVSEALERTDYITSTHRGHGHCLAKALVWTVCLLNCWERPLVTVGAKVVRCILQIPSPVTLVQMLLLVVAARLQRERLFQARCSRMGGLRCAILGKEHWGRAYCTRL